MVVVVDGYSTGAGLAAEFGTSGVDAVHVQSAAVIPDFYARTFDSSSYLASYVHQGDVAETVRALETWRPIAVVPGAEPGVVTAERIARLLGLPGNDPEQSRTRRDKFQMAEAAAAAGLRVGAQMRGSDPWDLSEWARERDHWPAVVKPLSSAGTDGVRFCSSPKEVYLAAKALIGGVDRMGWPNREVLVQEHLAGQQYFVNTVSWAGRHAVTEIWRETKREVVGAGAVCDREELLPYRGAEQDAVAAYVHDVLSALGVEFGAAHTEVMFTSDGPTLIETGARLQGTLDRGSVTRCVGADHVTATVEAYLDPSSVKRRAARGYQLAEHLWGVWLIAERSGWIQSVPAWPEIESLASFSGAVNVASAGEFLTRTVDLFSSPGLIYLAGDDEAQLLADYTKIRAVESRLFVTQGGAPRSRAPKE